MSHICVILESFSDLYKSFPSAGRTSYISYTTAESEEKTIKWPTGTSKCGNCVQNPRKIKNSLARVELNCWRKTTISRQFSSTRAKLTYTVKNIMIKTLEVLQTSQIICFSLARLELNCSQILLCTLQFSSN